MTTLRILGCELDEQDYFIDCDVDDITLDGVAILREAGVDDPRDWEMHLGTIDNIRAGNCAATHEELIDPTHQLWEILESLYSVRDDPTVENVADAIETNAEQLFQTVIEANTDANR